MGESRLRVTPAGAVVSNGACAVEITPTGITEHHDPECGHTPIGYQTGQEGDTVGS